MIRLAASHSPEDAAWRAFDDAALRLHRMYRLTENAAETSEARNRRQQLSIEVVKLWDVWRGAFLNPGGGSNV